MAADSSGRGRRGSQRGSGAGDGAVHPSWRAARSWPQASTLVAAVIGDPIRHSLSPVLLNAAFSHAGLDWVYVAFEVRKGEAGAALSAARTLGIRGMSVTMPHKMEIVPALDGCSTTVTKLGAANTVVRRVVGSRTILFGESTDGEGFINALEESARMDPDGRDCIVFGTGGAARAVVLALADHGAGRVGVVGRRAGAAEAAASLAGKAGRVASKREVAGADLIVNATPVGMLRPAAGAGAGADDALVGGDDIGPGQVVMDLVYEPRITPLLTTARERGAVAVGGVGMLVHQAALAFRLWTGEEPPLAAMWGSLRADGSGAGRAPTRPGDAGGQGACCSVPS